MLLVCRDRRTRTITIAIEPYRQAFKTGVSNQFTQLIEDSGSSQNGHVI
jgi:hypothetical protein